MTPLLAILGYLLLAPFLGGLIAGIDRITSARMQRRIGPPVFQPFYDLGKLIGKQNLAVNRFHGYYLVCSLLITILAGVMFFGGDDLLMVIFAFTVGKLFLVLAASSANSPYAALGAQRELIQVLAAEPMLLLFAVGLYMASGSFEISEIAASPRPLILYLPGLFLGLLVILAIEFRKSPFDLSTSHHAHQELVKGVTTEFAGPSLALVEITHWYETVLFLGMIGLFFAFCPLAAAFLVPLAYFAEIAIDNASARVTYRSLLAVAWLAAVILGVGNLVVLHIFLRAG
jgi:formate hydrogenlyase subunit 4